MRRKTKRSLSRDQLKRALWWRRRGRIDLMIL